MRAKRASSSNRGSTSFVCVCGGVVAWGEGVNSIPPFEFNHSPSSLLPYQIELDSACRAFIVVVTEGFPTRFIFSVGGGLGSATSATPPLLAALQNAVRATLGETPPPPPPPAAGKSRRGGAATPANRPPTAAAAAESARLLKRAMKASTLKALAARYSDIDSLDKLAAATRKVEELKAAVARNINKASERDILLDDIEHKSVSIRESAKTMFVASTRVADTVRCRRYILLLSVTLCILVIAAVLIVIINYSATPHPLWA